MQTMDEIRTTILKPAALPTPRDYCDPCYQVQRQVQQQQQESRLYESPGKGVILVTDDEGHAKYMRVMPDGHLGALEE